MWCSCRKVDGKPLLCEFHNSVLITNGDGAGLPKVLEDAMVRVETDLSWWDAKARRHCANHGRVVMVQAVGGGLMSLVGALQAVVVAYAVAPMFARWAGLLGVLVGLFVTAATVLNQQHRYNERWMQCRRLCDALEYHLYSCLNGLNEYSIVSGDSIQTHANERAARLVWTHRDLVKASRQ